MKELRKIASWVAWAMATAASQAAEPAATAPDAKKDVAYQASLETSVGYDSNVFMTDVEPDRTQYPNAQSPFVDSMVINVTPRVGLDYTPTAPFNLSVSYSPDMSFYPGSSSESHVSHRGALAVRGKREGLTWDVPNTFLYIQGSEDGPIYDTGAGGPPAIGAIPVRNRRRAFVFLNGVTVTKSIDKWFVRPLMNVYVHDFLTNQREPGLTVDGVANPWAGYENYEDRWEISGGLDAGYEFVKNTKFVAGYRYGYQDQGSLVLSPTGRGVVSPYDNNYHRALFGFEGSPWKWLRLNFLVGPDFREFGGNTPAGFDPNQVLVYAAGSIGLVPGKRDTVTFAFKRYEQPAFGGPSMYEDVTYDVTWRHRLATSWSVVAGFRAYGGLWQSPVQRSDWIYTPSVRLSYTFKKHWTAEAAYSYDWAESGVPNTPGREFTRHLASGGLRFSY